MRVGLDYRPALLGASGIGRYTRELCRAMGSLSDSPNSPDAALAEVALFGHSWKKSRFTEKELGLGGKMRLYRRRIPSRLLRLAHRVAGCSVESWIGNVDLFHFTDFVFPPLRQQTPFVATIHDTAFLESGFFPENTAKALQERARWAVAHARALLAPSSFAAGELVMRLGAKPGKVFVTALGSGHLPRLERMLETTAPYFLTVGTIEPRKNHLRILEALERLHAKGFPHRWKIAGGKGWMSEPFFARLATSPSRDRIELLGDVDDLALARLYAGASAVVYVSLYEGFGLPLVEAMRAGAPLITSALASMPEVAGDAAIFADPHRSESIAEAMTRVLEDHALRTRLCAAGEQRAAHFDWKRTAQATQQAYAAALTGNERPLARLF